MGVMTVAATLGNTIGPPGGERICGRSGWCGNNQSIRAVDADEAAVHLHFEIDHARDFEFGEHHVIERVEGGHLQAAAPEFAVQHPAALDAEIAMQGLFELGINFFNRDGGEESEAAEIHGEDGSFPPSDGARGGEQRSVAAENNHQSGLAGDFLAREPRARARVAGAVGVEANRYVAGVQPRDQVRDQLRGGLTARLADDAYCFDVRQVSTYSIRAYRRNSRFPSAPRMGLSMISEWNPSAWTAADTRSQAA